MKSSFFCLQEVILHRSVEHQKLGLTLCYGSLEDETTDIFISEVSGPQIPTLSEKLAYCMIEARLECSIIGPQHNLVVTLFTLSFSYFHGVGGSSTTLGINYLYGWLENQVLPLVSAISMGWGYQVTTLGDQMFN